MHGGVIAAHEEMSPPHDGSTWQVEASLRSVQTHAKLPVSEQLAASSHDPLAEQMQAGLLLSHAVLTAAHVDRSPLQEVSIVQVDASPRSVQVQALLPRSRQLS